MSFASEVKEELARHIPKSRHDLLAQTAAMVMMEGNIIARDGHTILSFLSENARVRSLFFTLIAKVSNIGAVVTEPRDGDLMELLTLLHMYGEEGLKTMTVDPLLLQQDCCRRAFVRGAFLSAGSVSDPNKAYHFEIICRAEAKAEQVAKVLLSMELDAKIISRKGYQDRKSTRLNSSHANISY